MNLFHLLNMKYMIASYISRVKLFYSAEDQFRRSIDLSINKIRIRIH